MRSVRRTSITALAEAVPELGAAQARFQKVAYPDPSTSVVPANYCGP